MALDERYRRMNEPTFGEWLEDVRAHANEHGDHTRQRHVERVKRLVAVRHAAQDWAVAGLCGNPKSDIDAKFFELLAALRADGMVA